MKKIVKKLVKSKFVQDQLRLIYNTLKTFNFNLLKDEIHFRNNGLPDKFPYPNSKLIFKIIAIPWVSEYYKSGKIIYSEMQDQLLKVNVELKNDFKLLDFGCGCGRLIRHFTTVKNVQLFGTDLNPQLIKWCNENLPGKYFVNNILPPLNFEDNFFDFIYARSVFTHLSADYQKNWINEIKRILKPNGIFYFTTHGINTAINLTAKEKNILVEKGIFEHNFFEEGDNKFSTYQTFIWTKENIINNFELLLFEEGKNTEHLSQDVYIIKKI